MTPSEIANTPSDRETVISSDPRVRLLQSLKDLWEYRELFTAFLVRDLKVRYKQTALGVVWVVLQPLLAGGVLSVVFRSVGAQQTLSAGESMLFFMAALTPWTSFASGMQTSAMSLEGNAGVVSKVYFPRMVIPLAHVLGSLVDFLIAFTVLALLALFVADRHIGLLLALLPLLLLIQFAASAGLGLFFGALNAQYRDVKYVLPFMLQMVMFVTVLRALDEWPAAVQRVLAFNPMAGVVEGYRAALGLNAGLNWALLAQGAAVAIVLLFLGVWFFRAREAKLVDIL